ncbi:MAG: FAD-dependent oxidoreductase, partial [Desulfobacterales bacterium]
MPAYGSEIEGALEEGVKISYLTAPESIITQNGHVIGLRCIKMKLGNPDASGRRRPIPIKGSEYEIKTDLVIPSIGQTMETPAEKSIKGIDIGKWGSFKVDPVTLATTRPGVYAGGDAVSGTATVIEAIAGGKKAAIAIDAYINGVEDPKFPPIPQKRADVEKIDVSEEKMARLKRPKIPLLEIEKRVCSFDQVELGLSEKAARDEAKRCLRCDLS